MAARVKLIMYNCSPTEDTKTRRLRAAVQDGGGSWQEATALSEQQLAQRVRDDGVDILVELTGHTAHNRLGVMAQRPAPIQASCLRPILLPSTSDSVLLSHYRNSDLLRPLNGAAFSGPLKHGPR